MHIFTHQIILVMKKYQLLFLVLCITQFNFAQTEIKLNVASIMINQQEISVEQQISPYFSAELAGNFRYGKRNGFLNDFDGQDFKPKQSGSAVRLAIKFYFKPERQIGMYTGAYIRNASYKFKDGNNLKNYYTKKSAFGLIFGNKIHITENAVFDINLGYGKYFNYERERYTYSADTPRPAQYDNMDLFYSISFGYRFN